MRFHTALPHPRWPSVTSLMGRLSATRPASYQIRNIPHQRTAVNRVRRLSSGFICVEPLNQHLMESGGTVQSGGGAPPPSFSISLDNQLRHTLLSEPAMLPMETLGNAPPAPVYYLKISVKILNKMTVCKPQRQKKGGGGLPSIFSGTQLKWELGNKRSSAGLCGGGCWRRQKEKEGHVFCFCSHYSSLAGRYPGRQCSSAGVW